MHTRRLVGGREGQKTRSPMPSGPTGRICTGYMGIKSRALPWEICLFATGLATLRSVAMDEQKSAEVILNRSAQR